MTNDVNERIALVRKALNLNQEDFAKKIKITRNAISLIETGGRNPSERTITDICRVFRVNPLWLNTGEGEMFIQQDKSDRISNWAAEVSIEEDTDRRRIVEALTTLSEEQWSLLAEIAKKIVDGD